MAAEWREASFSLTTDRGQQFKFFHWADVPLADAWLEEAEARFSLQATLEGKPWAEQRRAVLDAWTALGNAYRAANVPPFSDPAYVATLEKWVGALSAVDLENVKRQTVGPSMQAAMPFGGASSVMVERFRAAWSLLNGPAITPERYACGMFARVILGSDGRVAEYCAGDPWDASGCGPAGTSSGCAQLNADGSTWGRCGPPSMPAPDGYTWRTLAWKNPPVLPGGAASSYCAITIISNPLLWYYELGRVLAQSANARGAQRLIKDARLYVAAFNLKQLAAQNLLDVDELIDRAARIQHLPTTTIGESTEGQKILAGAALGAAALTAVYAPLGVVVGIAASVVALLPYAQGILTDRWGRAEPVYLLAQITGDVNESNRPTHDVADAPGPVERPEITLPPPSAPAPRVIFRNGAPAVAPRIPETVAEEMREAVADAQKSEPNALPAPGAAAATETTTAPPAATETPAATTPTPLYERPIFVGLAVTAFGIALDRLLSK